MAASISSARSSETSSKWKLLLAIGIPTVIGASALWYFYSKRGRAGEAHGSKSSKKAANSDVSSKADARNHAKKPPARSNSSERSDEEKKTPRERAQALKNRGNKKFAEGKYDEAIKFYTEAINVCPPDAKEDLATFYQNRAACFEHQSNWTLVREDCNKALELNPKYAKALQRRAKALEHEGDLRTALEDMTAVCVLDMFSNQGAVMQADRILRALGDQRARELLQDHNPSLPSHAVVRASLRSIPSLLDAELIESMLSLQLARDERYEEVEGQAGQDAETFSDNRRFHALLLRAHFRALSGAHQQALDDLRVIIESADASNHVRAVALSERAMVDADKADTDLIEALNADPDCVEALHQKAATKMAESDWKEASTLLEQVLRIRPEWSMIHFERALCQSRISDPGALDDCIKEHPNCIDGMMLCAQTMAEGQQWHEAERLFLSCHKLEPDNAAILVQRGMLKLQEGQDLQGAIALMEEALNVDPRCLLAYETLGTIEVQRGNLTRALELFERATKLAVSHAEMSSLCSLAEAARAQKNVIDRWGIQAPSPGAFF